MATARALACGSGGSWWPTVLPALTVLSPCSCPRPAASC